MGYQFAITAYWSEVVADGSVSLGSSSLMRASIAWSSLRTAGKPDSWADVAEPRKRLNSRPVMGSKRTPEVFWRLETLMK